MIVSILKVILILLEVVLLFNLLILVHELGHFLAAKWRGLVVEQFGIWFGKPLWKKRIKGVDYSLGWIPAGGFVKLPQLAPMEAIEGKNESDREALPQISALDKIIVAIAGPLFSFLLAVVFAVVVWGVGRPVGEGESTTVVGYVLPEGPAAEVGIQPGDKILKIDGHPVTRFQGMTDSVMWYVVRSENEKVEVLLERDGEELTFYPAAIVAPRDGWKRSNLRQIGLAPMTTPVIGRVEKDSPAEKAGLKPGDAILQANGKTLYNPVDLGGLVRESEGVPINLVIDRAGETWETTLTPVMMPASEGVPAFPRIGVVWDLGGRMQLIYPNPIEQVATSVESIVNTLGALFSPKSEIKAEHMSGPVMIMRVYYQMFEGPDGWRMALWFSVLLNVNLAILNMLPLPVLDGGHITIAILEGLRGKPINLRLLEFIQTACALFIIGYMLYVTFYDVNDLPIFDRSDPPPELSASPTPEPEGTPAVLETP